MNEFFSTAVWTLPASWLVTLLFLVNRELSSSVTKTLRLIGDISFEFFMVHQLILRYLEAGLLRIGISSYIAYGLALMFSCVIAYILHYARVPGKIKYE